MEPICATILERWAEYVNYDPNNRKFNLLDHSMEIQRKTDALAHIIKNYDETGLLAVMTVKRLFNRMMDDKRVSLSTVLNNPEEIYKHIEMKKYFDSYEIKKAEDLFIDRIKGLVLKVIGKDLIGNFNDETFKDKVFASIDNVISSIDNCKIEFYQKGGDFIENNNISTNINVFPSLAECTMTLSNSPDGMYLCFIDIQHSADSYFGFFIKNNGNILSFNDRIDERYKGQHCNARNGRWAENKADQIFPYDYIINYANPDYKGYSRTFLIDENKLDLFKLGEDAFLPLLIGMILINKSLTNLNKDEYAVMYMDSLFKINIPLLSNDKNELMVIENNNLVQYNNTVNLEFDYTKIMDGSALEEFKYENRKSDKDEYIMANNSNQLFVDLYGEGFKVQPTLFSTQKLLGTGEYSYIPEYVGSEHRMRCQAYVDIRQQLAEYINEQMDKELKSFGGISEVKRWYKQLINNNLDHLKKLAIEQYIAIKTGQQVNYRNYIVYHPEDHDNIKYYISTEENTSTVPIGYGSMYSGDTLLNKRDDKAKNLTYLDLDNQKPCSIFFIFNFVDYIGIKQLFNIEDIPKIITGWSLKGPAYEGNSNIDLTDPVASICTPFNKHVYNKYDGYAAEDTYYNFKFAIGFSKSGLKACAKSFGYDLNKVLKNIDKAAELD